MDATEDEWMVVGRKGRSVRVAASHADDDEMRPSSLQSSITDDGAFGDAIQFAVTPCIMIQRTISPRHAAKTLRHHVRHCSNL